MELLVISAGHNKFPMHAMAPMVYIFDGIIKEDCMLSMVPIRKCSVRPWRSEVANGAVHKVQCGSRVLHIRRVAG